MSEKARNNEETVFKAYHSNLSRTTTRPEWLQLLRSYRSKAGTIVRRPGPYLTKLFHEMFFDWRYGIQTSSLVPLGELGLPKELEVYGFRYRPSHVHTVKKGLAEVKKLIGSFEDQAFVDYGSGAGRVMILAAEEGFRKVIGVEASERMVCQSERNLEIYQNRKNPGIASVVHLMDATKYDPEDDCTVFFFFSPFQWEFYECVLERIEQSLSRRPRKAFLVNYAGSNGIQRHRFLESGYELVRTVSDGTGIEMDIFSLPRQKE